MPRLLLSFLLAALVTAAASGQSQPPAPPPGVAQPPRDTSTTADKPGTAVIRGRVVASDSGRPIRRAQVRVMGAELREGRTVDTDASGAFVIDELRAGRYTLTAVKAGFIQLQYGQLRAFEGGRPVDLRDGQTLEKIDFALPRGSVITGRVLDEFGEPVMDVQVAAMRYQFVRGQRRLAPVGRPAATNDIGEFRLFGLSPGQYYVSATQGSSLLTMMTTGAMPEPSDNRSGYAPTYYPGTPRGADAHALTLDVGQTLNDITITLSPVRTARVTGSLMNSDGKAVTTGTVMAMARNDPSFMPMAPAMLRPDGTFTLPGLAPGDYTLYGVALDAGAAGMEIATVDVSLSGEDVSGVQLMAARPVSVSGRVVVDAATATTFPAAAASLIAIPADPAAAGINTALPAKINEDLTFELKVPPGDVLLRLTGALGQFAIRSIRLGADDVVDSGVSVKAGEEIRDLEVEVTNKATTLVGAVTDRKGQPARDYSIVVFSQNEDLWRVNTRHIAVARPDQEGRFRARIPAGSFHVAALEYLEPGEQFDPGFLDTLRSRAVSFSITAAETKTLDLKLAPHP